MSILLECTAGSKRLISIIGCYFVLLDAHHAQLCGSMDVIRMEQENAIKHPLDFITNIAINVVGLISLERRSPQNCWVSMLGHVAGPKPHGCLDAASLGENDS